MNSDFITDAFSDHARVLTATGRALAGPLADLIAVVSDRLKAGGKVLLFGNGGSAADAQHIAAELVVRYVGDRPAIAALALSTDSSILTAAGNDLGFDQIFARQIAALGRPDDVVVAFSTSGRSPNVLLALETARRMGLATAAFSGRDGGALPGLADHMLVVPSDVTARIQEMHILLGHLLCEGIERSLHHEAVR
jgi:D-sedoheptulose 7-phosphate isomerase